MTRTEIFKSNARFLVFALLASFIIIQPGFQATPAFAAGTSCTGLSGNGTTESPFLITESADLDKVVDCDANQNYLLTQDIDRSASSTVIATFSGTLDGNNKSITGISISGTVNSVGLFGLVTDAEFKNLTISGAVVSASGSNNVGVLAGESATQITVSNITAIGFVVKGNVNVGGLVGKLNSGDASISDVVMTDISIEGAAGIGGLVGDVKESAFIHSVTVSSLSITASGSYVGGLVGYVDNGDASISYVVMADIEIKGNYDIGGLVGYVSKSASIHSVTFSSLSIIASGSGFNVGGLVGDVDNGDASISDVVMTDISIEGAADIGGLVGDVKESAFIHSVTVSRLSIIASGSDVGGLVGDVENGDASISNVVMADIEIKGNYDIGGLVGDVKESAFIHNVTVSSLSIIASGSGFNVGGLVGVVRSDASISDVVMTDISIEGAADIGGLVGDVKESAFIHSVTVSRLSIIASGSDVGGLVGYVDNGDASISYVVMADIEIKGNYDIGGLVGYVSKTAFIHNVTVSSLSIAASGSNVGGLVGIVRSDASISNVMMTDIEIKGDDDIGGLVGDLDIGDASISDVLMTDIDIRGGDRVGGLVGDVKESAFIHSVTVSRLSIIASGSDVGGLVGYIDNRDASISYVVMTDISIEGDDDIGGLVGDLDNGDASISYVLMTDIDIRGGDQVGGLVGYVDNGDASISYVVMTDISIEGTADIGGLVGEVHSGDASISDVLVIDARITGDVGVAGIGSIEGRASLLRVGLSNVSVSGSNSVGGFFSFVGSISATESYFAGTLLGNNPGGFAGSVSVSANLNQSYFSATGVSKAVSEVKDGSGNWIANSNQFGASSMTSDQAKLSATYQGWNFSTTWGIDQSGKYQHPLLRQSYLCVSMTTCLASAPIAPSTAGSATAGSATANTATYLGPVPNSVSQKLVVAGQDLMVSGIRLDSITAVSIDGLAATISSQSSSTLWIKVPMSLEIGSKDIVFDSRFGTITFLDAFELVQQPLAAELTNNQKLNAGTFKGFVAIYAKGYEGQRLSVQVAGKWFVVNALDSNFGRVVRFTGPNFLITVKIYVDRVLTKQMQLLTR
jgi:hypothetical protein